MEKPTKIDIDDFQRRSKEADLRIGAIFEELNVGLSAQSFINSNGTIGARPVFFDTLKRPEEKLVAE